MDKVLSSDGTAIAYDRVGHGPPVVIVDGPFGDRIADVSLAALLATAFTVYTYDRRGHGASGDVAPFDPNREYEDIEAVIAESGGTPYVYGHSTGSIIALEAAARGLAIGRLAVWEPPFVVDGSRPPLPADYRDRLDAMLADGRRRDMLDMYMTEAALFAVEQVAPMRDTSLWSRMESSAHTLLYDARLAGDFSMPARRLARVTVPTLVIDGGTASWLADAADAVAAAVPDASRLTLPGQPHLVSPDAIVPALREFFAA